jgi:3-isopropylmalate/(R)-2-methylmalate dehydratase small subunit
MSKIEQVTGMGLPLVLDDIDTDRIIPARFLRCVTFDGLEEHAFKDDRHHDPSHPFDDDRFRNAKVLVAGRNFGCGSSREHAPQALMRWGIAAVIGESFAEIFFGNCTSLGIPAVCADRSDIEKLAAAIHDNHQLELTLDLHQMEIRHGSQTITCTMPDSARTALTTGSHDFLSQLIDGKAHVEATAAQLPYMTGFGCV